MNEKTIRNALTSPWFYISITYFLFLYSVFPNLINPELDGDAATRFLAAPQLIHYNQYREWLPYIQIWGALVVFFQLPFVTLYIFPLLHLLIFLFFAVKIFHQYGNFTFFNRFIFQIIIFLFLFIPVIHRLSYQPYQEIPYLAVMAGIVYFTLRHHYPWQLWFVGMFVREQVWIYWACWLVSQLYIKRTRIFSHPATYIISAVPFFWAFITSRSIIPIVSKSEISFQFEVLMKRIYDLFELIIRYQYQYIFICLILSMLLCFCVRNHFTYQIKSIMFASILSVFVTASYIIVTNPYSVTPFNPRPLMPFLFLVPLWCFCLSLKNLPLFQLRSLLICLFIPALLFSSDLGFITRPLNLQQHPFYRDAEKIIQENKQSKNTFCFSGLDHWQEFMKYIVGTFKYEQFYEVQNGADTYSCNIIFKKSNTALQQQGLTLPNGTVLSKSNFVRTTH
jgi:hypothetical protein